MVSRPTAIICATVAAVAIGAIVIKAHEPKPHIHLIGEHGRIITYDKENER